MVSQAKHIEKFVIANRIVRILSILLILPFFLNPAAGMSQTETYCPPGQTPHFILGFAFLKGQLGDIMGEPLECEHYDEAGNAFQKTTTGQAFYLRRTDALTFTGGHQSWTWTRQGLEHSSNPPATPAEAMSPLITAPLSLRVMSYNILFGAGVSPYWEQRAANLRPFDYPGYRWPDILNVIKAAEPDILGIQEAADWDKETPAVVQQVADELGMNYFLAHAPSGLHLLLLTRLEIVETENLSDRIGNIGALRAMLASPERPQQSVHVFVVHLDPFSAATRTAQIARLVEEMAPYLHAPTILMGDTNVDCLAEPEGCQEYQLLSQAGWQLAAKERYLINQVWVSPTLAGSPSEIIFPGATFDISDHLPVGAVIELPPTTGNKGDGEIRR
jgi:endonuclease/exonuclease/phosphatase family metal-dependent hydrolase